MVSSERSVAESWEGLEEAAKDLGYGRRLKLGQRHHIGHHLPWNGGVMLHEQGFIRVHVPRLFPLPGTKGPDPDLMPGVAQLDGGWSRPPGGGITFTVQGKWVRQVRKDAVARALEPHLRAYREALATRAHAWRMLELHETLDRVWEAGIAPDGAQLAHPEDRRAWLLAAWGNTSDTPEGADVRERIAGFIVHRVQNSEDPFDEAELDEVIGTTAR